MQFRQFSYFLTVLTAVTCTSGAFAHGNYKGEAASAAPECLSTVYLAASGGSGVLSGGHHNEGDTGFGRLALGMYFPAFQLVQWAGIGAEIGIQSGNQMAISGYSGLIDASGGMRPQVILKPTIDLLVAVKATFFPEVPVAVLLKGGIAYRELQFADRTSFQHDHIRKVDGEFQAGLGYNITPHAMISAFYQGIYSQNTVGLRIDSTGNNSFLSNIPTQQAGFLGVEYTF